jgi:uncharacterized protein YdaU (DUF1376 family)
MNKEKSPAFQYYPRDVLMDTRVAAMSLEQFGAYWTLMSYVWLEGSLPLDEKNLARLLRVTPEEFRSLWDAVKALFKVKDGSITSPELDEQRKKQAAWRLKSAEGGRKSGEARRKGGSRVVQAPFKQTGSRMLEPKRKIASSSASSSSNAKADPPPTPSASVMTDEGEGGSAKSTEHQNPSQQQSEHVADLSAKAPAARQRTPKLAGGAESSGSRHPRDVRREYADANNLGGGWMTASEETRKYDANIDDWLRDGKPIKGQSRYARGRVDDSLFDDPPTTSEDVAAGSGEQDGDDDLLSRIGGIH